MIDLTDETAETQAVEAPTTPRRSGVSPTNFAAPSSRSDRPVRSLDKAVDSPSKLTTPSKVLKHRSYMADKKDVQWGRHLERHADWIASPTKESGEPSQVPLTPAKTATTTQDPLLRTPSGSFAVALPSPSQFLMSDDEELPPLPADLAAAARALPPPSYFDRPFEDSPAPSTELQFRAIAPSTPTKSVPRKKEKTAATKASPAKATSTKTTPSKPYPPIMPKPPGFPGTGVLLAESMGKPVERHTPSKPAPAQPAPAPKRRNRAKDRELCPYEGCGQMVQYGSMNQHIDEKHKQVRYACENEWCKKDFTRMKTMRE
jgi:hypothetical protein